MSLHYPPDPVPDSPILQEMETAESGPVRTALKMQDTRLHWQEGNLEFFGHEMLEAAIRNESDCMTFSDKLNFIIDWMQI